MKTRRLQVYNTLTHQKEDFIPLLEEGKAEFVGMYSCWPTVYRSPTIGNYRAFFTADLIRNTLKYICGYPVKSVMNITDVGHLTDDADCGEDKMEKGAVRECCTVRELASRYESEFLDILKKLHIDTFDVMPRATDHIQQQIEMVKILQDKGYTYEIPWDGIYMDTSKVEEYGKIMGPNYKKRLENLNAGERVEMWGKRHPTDFALRKVSPTDQKRQMERESPWGTGFPGWHIECSAMSSEYLGEQFDLHHGGADHITVHHPNEIAQSEAVFDHKPWVKYRVHNQFLQVDGGKMGKSLGNAYTLKDVEERGCTALDLRYFYFMALYSSFQNFTREALEQAKSARNNLKKKLQKAVSEFSLSFSNDEKVSSLQSLAEKIPTAESFIDEIDEAIKDNFNTPKLLSVINNVSHQITLEQLMVVYRLENNFLKLWLFEREEKAEIPTEITDLANQRLVAKTEKNYTLADQLRDQIQSQGYSIKDIPWGFEIEKI